MITAFYHPTNINAGISGVNSTLVVLAFGTTEKIACNNYENGNVSNYYIDTNDFETATILATDSNLDNPALAKGFYSDGDIVRERSGGSGPEPGYNICNNTVYVLKLSAGGDDATQICNQTNIETTISYDEPFEVGMTINIPIDGNVDSFKLLDATGSASNYIGKRLVIDDDKRLQSINDCTNIETFEPISLSTTFLSFPQNGGTKTVTLTTNGNWTSTGPIFNQNPTSGSNNTVITFSADPISVIEPQKNEYVEFTNDSGASITLSITQEGANFQS